MLNHRLPIGLQRRLGEVTATLFRPPRGTSIEHLALGGRPAERVTVGASERPRAVLYLHGGGYLVGSARMYRALAAHLARSSAAVVFNLDYRLAPEHVYPAAVDDAVAAFRELVDAHGYPPEMIAIAGDSAGGGLALATTRRLVDDGVHPAALVLLSPWTDPTDLAMPARDFVLSRAWLGEAAAAYRGSAQPTDPGYAPMWDELTGLPPMLVHYSAEEALRSQILRFVTRAKDAGADITVVELADVWHSAHLQAGMLRESTEAVHNVGLWLGRHFT